MHTAILADTLTPRCRLNSAVHRHKALSRSGLLERLFTLMFSGLVYPQIWEDPEIDLEAMALTSSSHVVTIASGGCNVMNYLADAPARISAVDLNPAHVALTRLKLTAAAHLPTYESFHRFFAEADRQENIETYWTHISPNLDAGSRAYWEKRSALGQRRISYMLWKEVTRAARSDARVIFRTAGSVSILPGRLDDEILSRWHYHDAESRALGYRDRSSIYGGFHRYSLAA